MFSGTSATMTIKSHENAIPLSNTSRQSIHQESSRGSDHIVDLEISAIPGGAVIRKTVGDSSQPHSSHGTSNEDETNSPPPGTASDYLQNIWRPYKYRFRVLAACMMCIGNGMNDSAPGALCPHLHSHSC